MKRLLILSAIMAVVTNPTLADDPARVGIQKFAFLPAEITIKAGQEVLWVNDEKRTPHTVQVPGVPESDLMFPGESFRHRFAEPGVYEYRCGPHPEMKGTVRVVP